MAAVSSPQPGLRVPGVHVEVHEAGFAVQRKPLVDHVSLGILPGEMVGLLGPSGCGKSTLLKLISGQLQATSGRIVLDGASPPGMPGAPPLGYVPQDDIVHGGLRVDRALTYSARLRLPADTPAAALKQRVDEIITLMELGERRSTRVERLSGGQRKRVSVGVELLTHPPLLLLDEPTAGLDPLLEEHMMDFFRSLARSGRTLLVSTHILQSIDHFDQVCLLAGGRVAFFGPPAAALQYFGVAQHAHLYRALAGAPEQLAAQWRVSQQYTQYVASRLSALSGGPHMNGPL